MIVVSVNALCFQKEKDYIKLWPSSKKSTQERRRSFAKHSVCQAQAHNVYRQA